MHYGEKSPLVRDRARGGWLSGWALGWGGCWGGAGAVGPVIPAPVSAGMGQVLRGPIIPAPIYTPLLLALAILNPHDLLCLTLYESMYCMMWWVKDPMAWYLLDLAPYPKHKSLEA